MRCRLGLACWIWQSVQMSRSYGEWAHHWLKYAEMLWHSLITYLCLYLYSLYFIIIYSYLTHSCMTAVGKANPETKDSQSDGISASSYIDLSFTKMRLFKGLKFWDKPIKRSDENSSSLLEFLRSFLKLWQESEVYWISALVNHCIPTDSQSETAVTSEDVAIPCSPIRPFCTATPLLKGSDRGPMWDC